MLRHADCNGKSKLMGCERESTDKEIKSLKLLCLNYIIENDIDITTLELPVDILEPLLQRFSKEEMINDNNLQIFFPLPYLNIGMNPISDKGLTHFAEKAMYNVSNQLLLINDAVY